MENRLGLNKKKTYELPDDTYVKTYQSSDTVKRLNITPNFNPDICLKGWGNKLEIQKNKASNYQIWIKTNNKELINFIKNYSMKKQGVSTPSINVWEIKKIILEEFYGKQNEAK